MGMSGMSLPRRRQRRNSRSAWQDLLLLLLLLLLHLMRLQLSLSRQQTHLLLRRHPDRHLHLRSHRRHRQRRHRAGRDRTRRQGSQRRGRRLRHRMVSIQRRMLKMGWWWWWRWSRWRYSVWWLDMTHHRPRWRSMGMLLMRVRTRRSRLDRYSGRAGLDIITLNPRARWHNLLVRVRVVHLYMTR